MQLTTGEPLADIALSLERQRNPDRDPRLVTGDAGLLAGYLATLRYVEARTRAALQCPSVVVDPRESRSAVSQRVLALAASR